MQSINLFTSTGLVKSVNEDVVGIRHLSPSETIACICDGHWGTDAANITNSRLLRHFPHNPTSARSLLSSIQAKLYIHDHSQHPPETSLLAVKVDFKNQKFSCLSYGDCRLIHIRNNRIIFSSPTHPTWLGALSYQGIRNRLSVLQGTSYTTHTIKPHDRLLLFTDGVDECVYEHPTIPISWLAKHDLEDIVKRAISHGAQDNISLINIEC